jgi:hypothetical protein
VSGLTFAADVLEFHNLSPMCDEKLEE